MALHVLLLHVGSELFACNAFAELEQTTQGLERYVVLGLRTLCLESLWVVTAHLAQVASS